MDEKFSGYLRRMNDSPVTDWAMARPKPLSLPWLVYISLTNLCNLRCVMCARAEMMRPNQGIMEERVFERIVESLPQSVKKVYLMKQGEPLLHPKIGEFAKVLKQYHPDVHVSLHTNAVLLTPQRFAEIAECIDSLGISISAITREHYKRIHGRDLFIVVLRNLSELREAVRDNKKKPYIFIDYVRQPFNAEFSDEQVIEFFSRFEFIDSVDLHYAHSFHGAVDFAESGLWKEAQEWMFPCCVFPWCSMTLLFDGEVSYCFVEAQEKISMGNILERAFEEIWNGRAYQEFRKLIAAKHFSQLESQGFLCRRCSWLWDLQIQSPRSLVGGYSLGRQRGGMDTGELLKSHCLSQGLEKALELYEAGQVLQSRAWLAFMAESLRYCRQRVRLSAQQAEEYTHGLEAIEQMLQLCDRVLEKYLIWERVGALVRSKGLSLTTRYHSLS